MSSSYQPTVASSATSSAVRLPKPTTLSGSTLGMKTPLSSYGSGPQPTGNPHTKTGGMSSGTHSYTAANPMTATHETRNATNGVPHANMHPGKF
jgi:hypothetical protein